AEAAAMRIGPYAIEPKVVLAPMAGVTDKPFRLLCKQLGAGLAVSEMTISDPRFWNTRKSLQRMDHAGEPDPVSVQIAGTEPGRRATTSPTAPRSSTSTWAARPRRCATPGPGQR